MPVSCTRGPRSRGNDPSSPAGVRVDAAGTHVDGRCRLHHLAGVHDHDLVGDLQQQRQVVSDEQHREAEALLQIQTSRRISFCTITSRPVVGSSMITTSGSTASAIAIMTRWRMPPESSCG